MFTRRLRLGVYMGTAELKDGPLRVLPIKKFLKELTDGHVTP